MSISNKNVDMLVFGLGQDGIVMSEHLSNRGIECMVLEKNRVAEAWRTCRWDSLVANGSCWHDKFPNLDCPHDLKCFVPHNEIDESFKNYAKMIDAPVKTGVDIQTIVKNKNKKGFMVETNNKVLRKSIAKYKTYKNIISAINWL